MKHGPEQIFDPARPAPSLIRSLCALKRDEVPDVATAITGLLGHAAPEVRDLISRGDSQARFRKLGEALALIESAQPSLMRRVRSSIERIVFLESGPEYWPRARACILHDVTNLSATQVALIVVHEATHGRLWRAGIRYGPAVRERVERICVRAELALLPNLPSGANLGRTHATEAE